VVAVTTFRDGKVVRETETPIREERFAAEDNPATRAEQLTRLQQNVIEATRATRRTRQTTGVVFEDVSVGTGGATVRLRHGLGRTARWAVVEWRRTTPGGTHGLERSTSTENDRDTLVLASYVAGTATIEVW
jgi:hypothetical protein